MADVSITLQNAKITVSKNKVQASIKAKDKVKWNCHDGTFNIVFKPGSNWSNPATSESGGVWKAESGPFTTEGKLEYGITAPGSTPLDPEIEVIP